MGERGRDSRKVAEFAAVTLCGRLGSQPVLTTTAGGKDFCELDVLVGERKFTVRFEDETARDICQYEKNEGVLLAGGLKWIEWKTKANQPFQKLIVECREIVVWRDILKVPGVVEDVV